MIDIPEVRRYVDYSSNYGAHAIKITMPLHGRTIEIWYSYTTPIAFRLTIATGGVHRAARKNQWDQTTGNHLRCTFDHETEDRLPAPEFLRRLDLAINGRWPSPLRARKPRQRPKPEPDRRQILLEVADESPP